MRRNNIAVPRLDSHDEMLSKSFYTDQPHFDDEIEKIFKASWLFVGLAKDLEKNHDFVCVDFAGISIVVQNFDGTLSAFQNTCSHRFNPLQYARSGNRPLICRYHFWRFNKDGFPLGTPGSSSAEAAKRCLKKYQVEQCGKFVFVSVREDCENLKIFLGDFYNILIEISSHMGAEISCNEIPHAANWKLLVENVLECYHCGAVHPDTFIKALGVGQKPLEDVFFSAEHSSCHFPRIPTAHESKRKRLLSHLDLRSFVHNSFYHIYIFPNFFLSSTEGTAFYVGSALPVAFDQTTLVSRFFGPNVQLTDIARRKQNFIDEQSTPLGVKVINEDRLVLEKIQATIGISEVEGCLTDQEVRIADFFRTYSARIYKD